MTTAPGAPPRPANTARTPAEDGWFFVEFTPGPPGRGRGAITPVDHWLGPAPPHRPVAGACRGRRLEATPVGSLGLFPIRLFVRGDRTPLAGPALSWAQLFELGHPHDDPALGRDISKLIRAR